MVGLKWMVGQNVFFWCERNQPINVFFVEANDSLVFTHPRFY